MSVRPFYSTSSFSQTLSSRHPFTTQWGTRTHSVMRLLLVLIFLGVSTLFPSTGKATLALKASIESLVDQADRIVYAEVYQVHIVPQRGERGEIYTQTSLDILEDWKGTGPHEITVQTLGGTLNDLTLKVAGTPRFKTGQKVIVFLKKDPNNQLNYVVGLAQGVFYLDETQKNWKEHTVIHLNPTSPANPHIYQDLTGLSFYIPSLNAQKPTLIDAQELRPTLRTFKDLKKQVARALLHPMTSDTSSVIELTPLHLKSSQAH